MNKNRFLLILQREYMSIVGKKSFIVMTLLMPVLIILLGCVPVLLQIINTNDEKTVAVIDETGRYADSFESNESFNFVVYDQEKCGNARQLYDSKGDELYAIVIIPRDVEKTNQVLVYSESTVSSVLINNLEHGMSKTLSDAKVKSYGIEGLEKILKECNVEVNVRSIKWSDGGSEEVSSTDVAMIVGVALSLLSYFFVLMYGAMIMNSVIEEKTNRIVEVIVSSCKPIELMLGKILGVALVGFTQVAIWAVLLGIAGMAFGMGFVGSAVASPEVVDAAATASAAVQESGTEGFMAMLLSINYAQILLFFVIYFIGGFLLYASLFAGFGSAVDQASDASQFTTPIMIVIIIALYASMACMENPDGEVAFWCSMIPFTSPMVMMVRLPYDVPVWQMIMSVVVLYGTAIALTALSAKIYRTGILLYGKKNSIKDVIKWIK
ncbi:MAG: ABC transporter permease [Muribaculaceae bacterium]